MILEGRNHHYALLDTITYIVKVCTADIETLLGQQIQELSIVFGLEDVAESEDIAEIKVASIHIFTINFVIRSQFALLKLSWTLLDRSIRIRQIKETRARFEVKVSDFRV